MPSVRKPPLATFGPTFLGKEKIKRFWQILKSAFWRQSGKNLVSFAFLGAVGCGNSAAILQQFCGGRSHLFSFLSRKIHVLASKTSKYADLSRKHYVNISGFLRQFCGRFSKVKIRLLVVKIAFLSILSPYPRSCRPFFPP